MQAVMEKASAAGEDSSDSEESSTQYTEQSNPSYRPQANSLAMALGMKVDPSSNAPAIREKSGGGVVSSGPQSRKSFMQAVMEKTSAAGEDSSDSEESSTQYTEQSNPSYRPRANSLAMALGMKVDPSSNTPAIREKSGGGVVASGPQSRKSFMQAEMEKTSAAGEDSSDSEESSRQYTEQSNPSYRPQANSLAMALGMKVDPSSNAPAIREKSGGGVVASGPQSRKSFMQAVMEKTSAAGEDSSDSEESSTQYTEQSNPSYRPQANSLAMALGMKVDPSSNAPAIREKSGGGVVASGPQSRKSFMQAVMEKTSAAGQNEGDSEESSRQYTEQSNPSYRPQANSLAMALGMKVDPSSNAPAIRKKSGRGVVAKLLNYY
ncbi:targeting protein for Xklp2 TPX2 [Nitzschia inconspicua]|uniref:Targeting protein for Xklp2 TPX2 n=1 Tax=Nitzschia inconspicua TaxID=303405 RepID=A0A9K3KQG1_9STRA|nr:targeting protein for Xklp2 TPX2 [Nitzschia inconspicua]